MGLGEFLAEDDWGGRLELGKPDRGPWLETGDMDAPSTETRDDILDSSDSERFGFPDSKCCCSSCELDSECIATVSPGRNDGSVVGLVDGCNSDAMFFPAWSSCWTRLGTGGTGGASGSSCLSPSWLPSDCDGATLSCSHDSSDDCDGAHWIAWRTW